MEHPVPPAPRIPKAGTGPDRSPGRHSRAGGARACVIGVRLPDALAIRAARRGLEGALPAVRIRAMGRFRESMRARHRWGLAVGIGAGPAVALIVELLRPRSRACARR